MLVARKTEEKTGPEVYTGNEREKNAINSWGNTEKLSTSLGDSNIHSDSHSPVFLPPCYPTTTFLNVGGISYVPVSTRETPKTPEFSLSC